MLSWVVDCHLPFGRSWGYFPVRESDSFSVMMVASALVSTKHLTGKPSIQQNGHHGGMWKDRESRYIPDFCTFPPAGAEGCPFRSLNFHLCPGIYSHMPNGILCCSEDTLILGFVLGQSHLRCLFCTAPAQVVRRTILGRSK